MSAECRRLTQVKRLTCIQDLAHGWINATDLCPSCTRAFMAALDGIAGPPVWHRAYAERANADTEVSP